METDKIQNHCHSSCDCDKPDVISGSGFREIVKRINQENTSIIGLYKNSVMLLFISAIMNAIFVGMLIYLTTKN